MLRLIDEWMQVIDAPTELPNILAKTLPAQVAQHIHVCMHD